MSFVSFAYAGLMLGAMALYYLLPKRFRWMVLLAASVVFYCLLDLRFLPFLLANVGVVYVCSRLLQARHDERRRTLKADGLAAPDKKAIRAKDKHARRVILAIGVVLNLGTLAVLKYGDFFVGSLYKLTGGFGSGAAFGGFGLLVPIGISYYTFQTTGYLIDVYAEKYPAQRNFAKLLLFAAFFPQILQGPIGRYDLMSPTLYAGNDFDAQGAKRGLQRFAWGMLKKLVVADVAAMLINDVLNAYWEYSGLTLVIVVLIYALQIYADFSGYTDMAIASAGMFGVKLSENFERPFFATSVADFWRRWHITLGAWFRDYLYYPFSLCKPALKFGKWTRKRIGGHVGKMAPAALTLCVVWLSTGLWHGADWTFLFWGMLNGFFIIVSMFLEPVYDKLRGWLRLDLKQPLYRCFSIARTFLLLSFIRIVNRLPAFSHAIAFYRRMFTRFLPSNLGDIASWLPMYGNNYFFTMLLGGLLMLIVSLIQTKRPVLDLLNDRCPLPVRWLVYYLVLFMLLLFSMSSAGTTEFMYIQF